VNQTEKRVSRKRGKTNILTSTPYKNELLAETNKKLKPTTKAKKSLPLPGPTSIAKARKTSKSTNAALPASKISRTELKSRNNNDDDCLYCHDVGMGGWIRCVNCGHIIVAQA
jgi:hypothetical protein